MKMPWVTLALCFLIIPVFGQRTSTTFRSHLSFELGGQFPLADMADRFGFNNTIGSQMEIMHTRNTWVAGLKGYYLFGNTVNEDVLTILRTPEGTIIGNDGAPAVVALRQRGLFIGPYLGKVFPVSEKRPHAGIKIQVGAGLLQHHVRIQDDTRSVVQLTGDYRKGYDKLSNGLAGYLFAGYQQLDPNKRVNFLAGIDLTYAGTESRRDYDFNLMRRDEMQRTDVLIGLRVGWILPITSGIPPEKIYY
jgi:hypothetical protein